jgi:hypothetical protein
MGGAVTVRVKGPLFDGAAEDAAVRLTADVQEALARQGAAIIKAKALKMDKSGRAGTGPGGPGAAAKAVKVLSAPSRTLISGDSARGSVWWPWLEGTSRRNQSTPFKGYHVFRLAQGVMSKRAPAVAQARLREYLPEMGGESA